MSIVIETVFVLSDKLKVIAKETSIENEHTWNTYVLKFNKKISWDALGMITHVAKWMENKDGDQKKCPAKELMRALKIKSNDDYEKKIYEKWYSLTYQKKMALKKGIFRIWLEIGGELKEKQDQSFREKFANALFNNNISRNPDISYFWLGDINNNIKIEFSDEKDEKTIISQLTRINKQVGDLQESLTHTESKEPPLSFITKKLESLRHHPSLKFYIPLNCAHSIYNRESDLDLEKEVDKFLESDRQSLLILGDSGSGKSTFCINLTLKLLDQYKKKEDSPFPIFIHLGESKSALEHQELIEKKLKDNGIVEQEICNLKNSQKFVFILDSYDELSQKQDIVSSSKLLQWKEAKIIITCRTQFFESEEIPTQLANQRLYIVPFSDKQIKKYLKEYAKSDESQWRSIDLYLNKISSLYNLKELATNPLLLYIITKTLPKTTSETKFTRAMLYQDFFDQWFDEQSRRLGPTKGFFRKYLFYTFAQNIAFQMFLANTLVIKRNLRNNEIDEDKKKENQFEAFFDSNNPQYIKACSGCPIQRTDDDTYRFMHKSFQEFCVARKLCEEINENNPINLNLKLLNNESAIIHFLVEMNIDKDKLFSFMLESRNDDAQIETASSNAATILAATMYCFSKKNLKGIKIPNANLYGAVLDQTDLSHSDLTGVNLQNAFLRNTNFSSSKMDKVQFGEKPYLETDRLVNFINRVSFNKDGSLLACVSFYSKITLWDVKSGRLKATFKEHCDEVKSVCFNHDGTILATGGSDGTTLLWDVDSGQLKVNLNGHSGCVNSITFNREGNLLACGTDDRSITLWNVENGKLWASLKGHKSKVESVCFNPDGTILASGSSDGSVRLWNIKNKQSKTTINVDCGDVTSVGYNEEGTILAIGGSDGTVRLWDVESGHIMATLDINGGYVTFVSFKEDGAILASGNSKGKVKLWDIKSYPIKTIFESTSGSHPNIIFNRDKIILASVSSDMKTIRFLDVEADQWGALFEGHHKSVKSVSFNQDETILASGGHEGTIKLWDVENGQLITTFNNLKEVESVCFNSDGTILASGGYNETIGLWDVTNKELKTTLKGHSCEVKCVSFNHDGTILASGVSDGTVTLWDVENDQLSDTFKIHGGCVNSVSFNHDGTILASGSDDKKIELWDVESGKPKITLNNLWSNSGVSIVSFNHDGTILASGSFDGTVFLWDVKSEKLRAILKGHSGCVNSITFNREGTMLASGSDDKSIMLWNVENTSIMDHLEDLNLFMFLVISFLFSKNLYKTEGLWDKESEKMVANFKGHSSKVKSVSFNHDGTILASGGSDGTIMLWDVKNRQRKTLIEIKDGDITSVSFNEDGTILASGGNDETIKLWNVENGQLINTLKNFKGVECVSFNHNGTTLASGGYNETISLWDIKSGKLKTNFKGYSGIVRSVRFNQDGTILASEGMDGKTELWDIESGKLKSTLEGHRSWVNCISFNHTGTIMASCRFKKIRLGNIENNIEVDKFKAALEDNKFNVNDIHFPTLTSGRGKKKIRLWDVKSGKLKSTLEGHNDWVDCVSFNREGTLLASVGNDDSIKVWDIRNLDNIFLLWTTNPQLFCKGANFKKVKGLSNLNQQLLIQRGAILSGFKSKINTMYRYFIKLFNFFSSGNS